jgi:hypothetical protein
MSDRFYLAGPMSGIPQFNFPAFFDAAAKLRERGYVIVSPAEIDNEENKGAALRSPDGKTHVNEDGTVGRAQKSWGDFLSRDVKLIADQVDGIIFLPNWEKSRGAKLEAFTALLSGGKRFAIYNDFFGPKYVSADYVRGILKANMP